MYNEILVIGKYDTIIGFKSIGLKTIFWENQSLKELGAEIDLGSKIVFVTEDVYEKIFSLIEKYEGKLFPLFITIPSLEENKQLAYTKIDNLIRKALGSGSTYE